MEAAGQPHPQLLRPGAVEGSRWLRPQAFQRGAVEATGRPRLASRRPAHVREEGEAQLPAVQVPAQAELARQLPKQAIRCLLFFLFFIKYIC